MVFWTAFAIHVLLGLSGVFALLTTEAVFRGRLWTAAFHVGLGLLFALAGGYVLDANLASS